MSVKAKRLILIYMVSALVTLSVVAAVAYRELGGHRRSASNSSARAFEAAVTAVDDMGRAMKKSGYVSGAALGRSLCARSYAEALAAEAAISTLPFSTQELEQLSGFLNRAGDYCYSLCAQADDELSEEQRKNLTAMSIKADEFCAQLRQMQAALYDGSLSMDTELTAPYNVGLENLNLLSAALLDYEHGFEAPEEFSYDGQFSPVSKAEEAAIDADSAKRAAAMAAGVEPRELMEEECYENQSHRCYSLGSLFMCVGKNGLESMAQSRLVGSAEIEPAQAEKTAEDFLSMLGYKNLAVSEKSDKGRVMSYEFCPVQDGAIRLDEGIKISIAMDDGSVYGFDATKYSDEAAELKWNVDEEQARSTLLPELECTSSRKVIIKSAGGSRTAAYELSCTAPDGTQLKLYVDASDGRQCKIETE